jgi:hypothetical protein
MNAVSRVFRGLHAVYSSDDPATVSPWRELLAVCSLPGVFAAPLAFLHNLPWVPFQGPDESIGDQMVASRLWERAWPLDVALGAAVAVFGAILVQSGFRLRELEVKPPGSALGRRLTAWFPNLTAASIRLAVLLCTWLAALIGGGLGLGVFALLGGVESGLAVVGALGLSGVSCLLGLPLLADPRLRRPEVLLPRLFMIWVVLATTLGGALFGCVLDRLWSIGVGFRGPGVFVFILAVYFAWGSGTAAYLTYRLLRRGYLRATGDPMSDATAKGTE